MHVVVRLGSGLATAAGTRRLRVELPPQSTVGTLLERLRETQPAIAPALDSARPVVRGSHAGEAETLAEGDEIALLIPVAGGMAGLIASNRRKEWP